MGLFGWFLLGDVGKRVGKSCILVDVSFVASFVLVVVIRKLWRLVVVIFFRVFLSDVLRSYWLCLL